jgi:hypothetical protein
MLQMAPKYEHLTLLQKVEVLQHALDNTTGTDLAKVLWFKSRNSEMWLYRRTNYTRSLAVMSMVGYVLGLGDRHPSNLALHRRSGKILHIDFGDCFEVGQLAWATIAGVAWSGRVRILLYSECVSRLTCLHGEASGFGLGLYLCVNDDAYGLAVHLECLGVNRLP